MPLPEGASLLARGVTRNNFVRCNGPRPVASLGLPGKIAPYILVWLPHSLLSAAGKKLRAPFESHAQRAEGFAVEHVGQDDDCNRAAIRFDAATDDGELRMDELFAD